MVEAMALEKPVIYMRSGPGPEVIEDGVSGLLCDTHDPDDIASKILFLLEHPEIGFKMGRSARQRVVEKFELNKWVDENIRFYQDCISHYKNNNR